MSELAFDEDGQHFQVPATVTRWRIRRFNNPGKPGGAQVVYGDDGLPLYLAVETTAEEFRDAVGGVPGRYRLDGVEGHGRIVDGVPTAYLMINNPASSGGGYSGGGYNSSPPPTNSSLEYAVVELARANRDAMTAMADRFSGVCDALSNVVRAVDGAGLPRRAPLGPLLVDQGDDDDDDDGERNAAPVAPQATFATLLGQVVQMVQVFAQMNGSGPAKLGTVIGQVVETAKVAEAVVTTTSEPDETPADEPTNEGDDARASAHIVNGAPVANGVHASYGAPRQAAKSRPPSSAAGMSPASTSAASESASVPSAPAADPAVQFAQIMAALTPEEQAQVQYVVTRLSMGDLMQWYEQLARLTVAEGVARIRAELARVPMEHAA